MTPVRILVVDDDPEVRTLLQRCFELEGYEVLEAADGVTMRRIIDQGPVALITLDLKLGGEDGLSLAREVRATRTIPIIMITGKDDPVDRVVGLEVGADDYIAKPFHLREVLARVRAVLRRSPQSGPPLNPAEAVVAERGFGFDGFILVPSRRELKNPAGQVIPLTTAEFNMLIMFLERPGRVLSRDSMMDILKGHDWSPLDRSIDTLVGRVRKKIEANVEEPRFIKTVRGVGYAFAAQVSSL
ncbi:response regulator [Terrarubrum flagellatum]|uniref:response regulator n=1 Tax=Terrirubrum flagellatum TaxID=2895980 RepID=UPI003144EF91